MTPATRPSWVIGTPLGVPEEPDVYIIQHRSSGLGGTGSTGLALPSSMRSETETMVNSGCEVLKLSISSSEMGEVVESL